MSFIYSAYREKWLPEGEAKGRKPVRILVTEVCLREDDSPKQGSDSAVETRRNEGERWGGGRETGMHCVPRR